MGAVVVDWLSGQGLEVYQEVTVRGGIADIVATAPLGGRRGRRVTVIELKLSLGLRVIDQARSWRPIAHQVYVATPPLGRGSGFAIKVATMFGLGVLEVRPSAAQYGGPAVTELQPAPLNRRAHTDHILDRLSPEHKTFAVAGNAEGRRWTPFQQTCSAVRAYVTAHPGATLKETIDAVKTHYGTPATARACIAGYVERGVISGLRLERAGRVARLYPQEAANG